MNLINIIIIIIPFYGKTYQFIVEAYWAYYLILGVIFKSNLVSMNDIEK